MSFNQFKLDLLNQQSRGIYNTFIYKTDDTIADILTPGYFTESRFAGQSPDIWTDGLIESECIDGFIVGKINTAGDLTQVVTPGSGDISSATPFATNNALIVVDGTGKDIKEVALITAAGEVFTIKGSAVNSKGSLIFKDSTGADVGEVSHDDNTNKFRIESDKEIDIVSTSSLIALTTTDTVGRTVMINANAPDTSLAFAFENSGSEGSASGYFVGDRPAEGNVPSNLSFFHIDTTANRISFKRTNPALVTGWEFIDGNVNTDLTSSTANALIVADGIGGDKIKEVEQLTASGGELSFKPLLATGKSEITFKNSAGVSRGSIFNDDNLAQFEIKSELHPFEIFAQSGLKLINNSTTAKISLINFLLDGTQVGMTLQNAGTSGGSVDFIIRNTDPEGVVTATAGTICYVDSSTAPGIFIKRLEGGTTGFDDLIGIPAQGEIVRSTSAGSDTKAITAIKTQYTGFDTNASSTGNLTSDQANNEIRIEDVRDTINGDLYDVQATIDYELTSSTDVIFEIVSDNGVSDTGHDIVSETETGVPIGVGSFQSKHTTLSGTFRGPTSLTGNGAIKLLFYGPAAVGSVNFFTTRLKAMRTR